MCLGIPPRFLFWRLRDLYASANTPRAGAPLLPNAMGVLLDVYPCFLAACGIFAGLVSMAKGKVLENVPNCCESFILAMVRCLLVFGMLFIFQAPMEIGCFLYGYSLDAMPADGNEYTGAISQW